MQTSTKKRSGDIILGLVFIFFLPSVVQAQVVRPYSLVYSNSMKGGHTMFGNTSLTIKSSNGVVQTNQVNDFGSYGNGKTSQYGNDNSNMQYVDIDDSSSTFNSSSADLLLPSTGTNTIKFARLYWGGRISSGTGGAGNINLRTIKIRKGTTGAYTSAVAPAAQVDKALASTSQSDSVYQCYVDVTNFLKENGAGTYTVANVAAATGSRSSGGYYGGWSIVVAYENPSVPFSSVRVYDGYLQVYDGGSVTNQSITLNGFNAPSTPLDSSDAYMTTMAWEGDANLAASSDNPLGDYVKINNNIVSNAANPAVNFWNGTVSKNGAFVTSKYPDYKNQMGIDIDEQNVGIGYGITSNTTTVTAEFGTEADQYFPSVFAFTMKTKVPNVTIEKAVKDAVAPYNILQTNEDLTYTMTGSNVGVGPAYNCTIVDTIPSNVVYIPGTLEIVTSPDNSMIGPKTDASGDDVAFKDVSGGKAYVKFYIGAGATSTSGGVLQPGQSYSIRFKVRTPGAANQISTVVNSVRITGEALSGDPFVDDATAIIGPEGGPLSVKLNLFTVSKMNNDVVVKWTTVSETQNDHFEIEQSTDGINFSTIGTAKGSGTTQLTNNYQFVNSAFNSAAKVLYYRLKIYDMEGNITYTKIVSLHISGEATVRNFTLYPNPFVSSIKMQIQSETDENAIVRITNVNGQLLIKRTVSLAPGENIVVLKDLDRLPNGVHNIEILTNGKVIQQKIIKQ